MRFISGIVGFVLGVGVTLLTTDRLRGPGELPTGASVKSGITSPRSMEDAVPKTGAVTTDAAEDGEWKIVESSGSGEAAAQAAAEALLPEMPRVELGHLIRLFLVDVDQHPSWAMLADGSGPVRWVTDGISSVEAEISSQRVGVGRVSVDGAIMTALRREAVELPWNILLGSTLPPKFGPQFVAIEPNMSCFGSAGSGCDFAIEATLRGAGIAFQRLCASLPAGSGVEVYTLEAPGKQKAWLEYWVSVGSGGASNWVTVFWSEEDLSEPATACLRTVDAAAGN
jgi:hypothetical protein